MTLGERRGFGGTAGWVLAAVLALLVWGSAPAQERESRSERLREQVRLGSALTLADYLREEEASRRRLDERFDRIERRLERIEERLSALVEALAEKR